MCTKAPDCCSRKCAAQARLMLNEPLQMHADHVRPVRPTHAMEDAVAQDAGIVDQDVDAAERRRARP